MNKKCQKAGIKMIAEKNYGVSADLLDLESIVDSNLTYPENFANIKPYILLLSYKCVCVENSNGIVWRYVVDD